MVNRPPALVYAGTIVATTTAEDNAGTATPFTLPDGHTLVVQPDVACYVASISSASGAATTSDPLIQANAWVDLSLVKGHVHLSAKAVSGTVNLKVYVAHYR